MQGFKNKLIGWILNKYDPDVGDSEEVIFKYLDIMLKKLALQYMNPTDFEKTIYEMIFNSYYAEHADEPYAKLLQFKQQAGKGDTSFKADPFFRVMRRMNDKQVRTLNYILKRNGN